jgi:hypothetical protein
MITVDECVAVEGEDAVRRGIVDDRVGVLGRVHLAQRLQGFQIEHDDRAVIAEVAKPCSSSLRDRDAMRAVDARDLADGFAGRITTIRVCH